MNAGLRSRRRWTHHELRAPSSAPLHSAPWRGAPHCAANVASDRYARGEIKFPLSRAHDDVAATRKIDAERRVDRADDYDEEPTTVYSIAELLV